MLIEGATTNIANDVIRFWTDGGVANAPKKELPNYLKNNFLINNIAQQSSSIIQIYDMENFKPVYTSPNCLKLTGFTDNEINTNGFVYWLMSLPLKQTLFYLKSAKFVNEKIKQLSTNNLHFSNQCINLAYKNKAKELRSMVSTNTCIEWKGNKQQYQLIIWQDMTNKFKSNEFLVRYQIGSNIYNYQSVNNKFKDVDLITDKEAEIIKEFNLGLSSKDTAHKLSISSFTVDNHKKNLLAKFNTSSMQDVLEILKFTGIIN